MHSSPNRCNSCRLTDGRERTASSVALEFGLIKTDIGRDDIDVSSMGAGDVCARFGKLTGIYITCSAYCAASGKGLKASFLIEGLVTSAGCFEFLTL